MAASSWLAATSLSSTILRLRLRPSFLTSRMVSKVPLSLPDIVPYSDCCVTHSHFEKVTNPMDGSAILLPLSPPDFVPEVLVCGGSPTNPAIQPANLSSQMPATTQCSRIMLTDEGIAAGWQIEHMLEPRTMPELVHLPNGQVYFLARTLSNTHC